MILISNLKIGRKITLALGGITLILAGLSTLSLWGSSTNERLAATLVRALTKARLLEMVDGGSVALAMNIEKIVIEKKVTNDLMKQIGDQRKVRNIALDGFKALADNPVEIRQGEELTDIAQAKLSWIW